MKKLLLLMLILALALFAVMGCEESDGAVAEVSEAEADSSAGPVDTPDDQLVDLAVGDSVTIDGVTVSVNSVEPGPDSVVFGDTLQVNVTYVNESGGRISVTSYDWKTVLESGSDQAHVGGRDTFSRTTLRDGEDFTGNVILVEDRATKIKFDPTLWTDKEATWLLP